LGTTPHMAGGMFAPPARGKKEHPAPPGGGPPPHHFFRGPPPPLLSHPPAPVRHVPGRSPRAPSVGGGARPPPPPPPPTPARRARHPDRGRGRAAGFRGGDLVCPGGAGGNAARHRYASQH